MRAAGSAESAASAVSATSAAYLEVAVDFSAITVGLSIRKGLHDIIY